MAKEVKKGMRVDLTPVELLRLEKKAVAEGHFDLLESMEETMVTNLKTGEYRHLYSQKDIELRREYPIFGKLYHDFKHLYERLAEFEGGLEFLKEKDSELAAYIENGGKGNPDSYLVKWFHGELDEGFHFSERNDALLLQKLCDEARRTMSNWIVTDSDCLQVRRQVGYEDRGIFQLMQVDTLGEGSVGDPTVYQLAWAEIDIEDYTQKEINSTLNSYGYESFKELIAAAGSRNEAYGQLGEMLFEDISLESHVMEFTKWNEVLDEVQKRTGLDLSMYREIEDKEINALIQAAENAKNSGPREKTQRDSAEFCEAPKAVR